jgi:hypothetical protein
MPKRPSPPAASRRPLSARKRAALAADRALPEEIWRNGRGPKAPRAALTADELEALLAPAARAAPCIFDELGGADGERLRAAWLSGQAKLRQALAARTR